jgi:hypothetical protein
VSYGGWAIDHHPVDNIYSHDAPCTQWHSKGVYQIPYRTMYSRNVPNLFVTGRLLSASHIAFGSSRVMATCGHNGQAVGVAAAICRERSLTPRDLADPTKVGELQQRLLRTGQTIPGVRRRDKDDLAQRAEVTASSSLDRLRFEPSGTRALTDARAILLPLAKGPVPSIGVRVRSRGEQTLVAELRVCSRSESFTPDVVLDRVPVALRAAAVAPTASVHSNGSAAHRPSHALRANASGQYATVALLDHEDDGDKGWSEHEVTLRFTAALEEDAYAFVCLQANAAIEVWETSALVTGVTTVAHRHDTKVAKSATQTPPENAGLDRVEFWTPERRPRGRNLAVSVDLAPHVYAAGQVVNGVQRPTHSANAWVASPDDRRPTLTLSWPNEVSLRRVELVFDPDWDHPMENVVMRHPQRVMPTTVRSGRVRGAGGILLAEIEDNHESVWTITLPEAVSTDRLDLELDHPSSEVPAALFEVRCYAS